MSVLFWLSWGISKPCLLSWVISGRFLLSCVISKPCWLSLGDSLPF